MIEAEIPEPLAEEAKMNSRTIEEAEEYVMDRVDQVRLVWPDDK